MNTGPSLFTVVMAHKLRDADGILYFLAFNYDNSIRNAKSLFLLVLRLYNRLQSAICIVMMGGFSHDCYILTEEYTKNLNRLHTSHKSQTRK